MKKFLIKVNNKSYEVEVEEVGSSPSAAAVQQNVQETAPVAPPVKVAAPAPVTAVDTSAPADATEVTSPMPGNVIKIMVNKGDKVAEGDVLLILEAMKMENEIKAPTAGEVVAVATANGAAVNSGDLLVAIA